MPSSAHTLPIGALSRATGIKVPTIRYYEEIGLLHASFRSAGNQRRYDETHVTRLSFIHHARDLGFSIDAIRTLIDLAAHPSKPCKEADALAEAHLHEINRRIALLEGLRDELSRMLTTCKGSSAEECRILEALSHHEDCVHEKHGGKGIGF